jgi:hypothetical protein
MNTQTKIRQSLVALLAASVMIVTLMVYVVQAAVISVDEFDDGDGIGGYRAVCDGTGVVCSLLGQVESVTISDTTDVTGALGGERDLWITKTAGTGDIILYVNKDDTGLLTLNTESATKGIAEVVWDGDDNDPTVISTTLLNLDLVAGANDAFLIQSVSDDQPSALLVTVWCSASNYSEATVSLPGGIGIGSVVDFIVPYSSFTVAGGAGCDPGATDSTPARAIRLFIDGTISDGTDLTIDRIETTGGRDFGDAPDSYLTTKGVDGARHVPLGLRLGTSVDTEVDGPVSGDGSNDDDASVNPDDEDGVYRDLNDLWTNGASVDLLVTVNGCVSPPCYLNGWIDWKGDNSFLDAGDRIFTNTQVFNGFSQSFAITVPDAISYTQGSSVYARFRLCPDSSGAGSCDTVTGQTIDGEVEDYLWRFTRTSITLQSLIATGGSQGAMAALGGLLILVLLSFALVASHRRRQAV